MLLFSKGKLFVKQEIKRTFKGRFVLLVIEFGQLYNMLFYIKFI